MTSLIWKQDKTIQAKPKFKVIHVRIKNERTDQVLVVILMYFTTEINKLILIWNHLFSILGKWGRLYSRTRAIQDSFYRNEIVNKNCQMAKVDFDLSCRNKNSKHDTGNLRIQLTEESHSERRNGFKQENNLRNVHLKKIIIIFAFFNNKYRNI